MIIRIDRSNQTSSMPQILSKKTKKTENKEKSSVAKVQKQNNLLEYDV